MNYEEAQKCVTESSKFGMKLGLERMKRLLDIIENPENSLKYIHVTGTNGKGSVTTMMKNILMKSGYKVGIYSSPSVLEYRERMMINEDMIPKEEFAICASKVLNASKLLPKDDPATQFEIETAIALEWFNQQKCDYVCLEVGLGGRFDSTNVIKRAEIQIITSISLDHTAVLGNSIKEIAYEKAGIIKGKTTVLYPIQEEEAILTIKAVCDSKQSSLVIPEISSFKRIGNDWEDGNFEYDGRKYNKSLHGDFQFYNCITVIKAANELKKQGIGITEEAIKYGIENTFLPARMEMLSKKPFILLDGSHNPEGALEIKKMIEEQGVGDAIIIMGVLADKDSEKMIKSVIGYAGEIFTVTPKNDRALQAGKLADKINAIRNVAIAYDSVTDAIKDGLVKLKKAEGPRSLIIFGSFYLAGEARPVIKRMLNGIA